MTKKIVCSLVCCLLFLNRIPVRAQAIDNTASYKNIAADHYVRLNYENDFFAATDKYYTQGIHLELVAPEIHNFPLSHPLLHLPGCTMKYGLGLEHEGYTPSSISNPAILYGDRPFAACFFLKTFAISTDPLNGRRLSSSLSTGVIGQAAGGMEMQTGIHRWLKNITPHGWPNQVHNDAIINYQIDYEQQLVHVKDNFALIASGTGRAGTLSDLIGIGTTIMAGRFDSPFTVGNENVRNFRIYAYEHLGVNLVGYDATMQGGVFNHTSPYTLSAGDIARTVFQNRFGFVVAWQHLHLEYFQSLLSNEFKTGNFHVWGGVQIAVSY